MNNMEYWNDLKTPPIWAVKPIVAGRLVGKSDINPQWRYMAMTEKFGICGFGWKYEIIKQWTEPGPEGQVFAFCEIKVFVKTDGQWSDGIPGIGGDMLIEKEKSGLHANDDAFKMATTDALGVAMKMLGVAADVYCGENYSKYKKNNPENKSADKNQYQQERKKIILDITEIVKDKFTDLDKEKIRQKIKTTKDLKELKSYKDEIKKESDLLPSVNIDNPKQQEFENDIPWETSEDIF